MENKILEILKKYYKLSKEELDEGCYINGRWFSVEEVVKVIKENL